MGAVGPPARGYSGTRGSTETSGNARKIKSGSRLAGPTHSKALSLDIKILTFPTLYPDSTRPAHGIFVENRLRHPLAASTVQSRVVAPVLWFPVAGRPFGALTQGEAYRQTRGIRSNLS